MLENSFQMRNFAIVHVSMNSSTAITNNFYSEQDKKVCWWAKTKFLALKLHLDLKFVNTFDLSHIHGCKDQTRPSTYPT